MPIFFSTRCVLFYDRKKRKNIAEFGCVRCSITKKTVYLQHERRATIRFILIFHTCGSENLLLMEWGDAMDKFVIARLHFYVIFREYKAVINNQTRRSLSKTKKASTFAVWVMMSDWRMCLIPFAILTDEYFIDFRLKDSISFAIFWFIHVTFHRQNKSFCWIQKAKALTLLDFS